MNAPGAISRIIICNVGHGQAVVVDDRKAQALTVIDTGRDYARLSRILKSLAPGGSPIRISNLILSHLDDDHCLAALPLLRERSSWTADRVIRVNPEPGGKNRRRRELIEHLRKLERDEGLNVLKPATREAKIAPGDFNIRIVAPTEAQLLGRSTANDACAIVRVSAVTDSTEALLIGSDLDRNAHEDCRRLNLSPDFQARHLLFPHHGGYLVRSKKDKEEANRQAARQILDDVNPEVVIFSMGKRLGNPRPEIMEEARRRSRVLCTDFSTRCARGTVGHPNRIYDFGDHKRCEKRSCAGDVIIELRNGRLQLAGHHEGHAGFVKEIETARCR